MQFEIKTNCTKGQHYVDKEKIKCNHIVLNHAIVIY